MSVHVLVAGAVLGQPIGGVRRHTVELLPRVARRLEEAGGSLTVLAPRPGAATLGLPAGVPTLPSSVPCAPVFARARAETRELRRTLAQAAERGQPFDLVHSGHLPAPRLLGSPGRPGVPRTHTFHDLRSCDPALVGRWRAALGRRIARAAARGARRVFCMTEHVRLEIERELSVDPDRITVLGNGVDHFEPLERSPVKGAPLLCVGHLEPRKNQRVLLRALAGDEGLPDLWLVGAEKRGGRRRLAALASELGITQRVHFLGEISDDELLQLYASAACVVLPSRVEGFGMVAAEAQFARVPLAIARTGALREVAAPATPCFDPNDPAECRGAIRAALALSDAAVEDAHRHALRYRWDSIAERWYSAWTESVSGVGVRAR